MTTDKTIEILYEKGPCLAVMKPAGVLTQAPPGIDSIEVRVKSFLQGREAKTGNIYLGVPHRLDRPATGVLLLARHVRATRRLAQQFADRQVRKTYWALVEGDIQPDEDTWIDVVHKIHGRPCAEVVDPQHPHGKQAILHYRVRGRAQATTLLEIELQTGRTHQVRLQSAVRGHPILGDQQYGSLRPFGPDTHEWREQAIALHAGRIEFQHPMTREPVAVQAPLPWYWIKGSGLIDLGLVSC
ncbi:MAG: hypothetical protein A2W31_02325 [Planctomycetes bacterium RBG_16_64_10]|nr:MAG: hypothetical protein A2W31_02325 [Planctomycetes bacterium RBG_16_64_10]